MKNRGEEGVGWRWEAVLTGGPQLAASGRERRGRKRGWRAGPSLQREKSEGGRSWAGGPAGLKGGKREEGWGVWDFFFFKPFQTSNSNIF
jgi:hypothetical protein